uniref:NADH-ubiquinone oxidoreductase chain 3 n=1 Tax=Tenebrionoidea sp. 19 KM-2017 TaxID=2219474 RepID=A0A346RIZ9_9CUCU|nr:NADH dehydrogenase subunit 3 [Tenebrionoidea sp. 19 KM-2017]
MMILITMISLILTAMIIIVNLISKKSYSDREKSSPFECGFDPKSLARMPFSLQFFLIAVIFLIFDVEIVLLIPTILVMKSNNMMMFSMLVMFFMIILLVGLYHEWKEGALDWMS